YLQHLVSRLCFYLKITAERIGVHTYSRLGCWLFYAYIAHPYHERILSRRAVGISGLHMVQGTLRRCGKGHGYIGIAESGSRCPLVLQGRIALHHHLCLAAHTNYGIESDDSSPSPVSDLQAGRLAVSRQRSTGTGSRKRTQRKLPKAAATGQSRYRHLNKGSRSRNGGGAAKGGIIYSGHSGTAQVVADGKGYRCCCSPLYAESRRHTAPYGIRAGGIGSGTAQGAYPNGVDTAQAAGFQKQTGIV